jgi:hypothetical protein
LNLQNFTEAERVCPAFYIKRSLLTRFLGLPVAEIQHQHAPVQVRQEEHGAGSTEQSAKGENVGEMLPLSHEGTPRRLVPSWPILLWQCS